MTHILLQNLERGTMVEVYSTTYLALKFLHCLLSFSALGVAYEGNPMWAQEVGHRLVKASLSSGMWHTLHIVYLSYLRDKYCQSFKKEQQYLARRKLNAHRNLIFLKGCIKVFLLMCSSIASTTCCESI